MLRKLARALRALLVSRREHGRDRHTADPAEAAPGARSADAAARRGPARPPAPSLQRETSQRESHPQTETACPYCAKNFQVPPQRKRKCPECRADVHVKRVPGEDVRRLFTTEQAHALDAEWERIDAHDRSERALEPFAAALPSAQRKNRPEDPPPRVFPTSPRDS